MFKHVLLIILVSLFASGCGGVSEKTTSDTLERDPSFAKALQKKENAARKIEGLELSIKKAQEEANSEIGFLRKGLTAKKAKIKEEIRIQKNKIVPLIDAISAELRETRIEYDMVKNALKERVGKLKSIRSLLLKKDDLTLTGDEIALWNRRTEELDREINSLKEELDDLSAEIHLLKTEIRILKS